MGDRLNTAFTRAKAFIDANKDAFRGLDHQTSLEKLNQVAPTLFDDLNKSFHSEVDNGDIYQYANDHPGSFVWQLQPTESPVSPPPPPPGPDTSAALQEEERKRTEAMLQQRLEGIFGQVQDSGAKTIESKFMPIRARAVADEAALGRLRSPLSAPAIGRIDEQQGQALSQLVGSVAAQKASGQLDVSKAIEGILAGDRDAERRATQFGQDLDFRKSSLSQDVALRQQQLALERELGIRKLDLATPGWDDKVIGGVDTFSGLLKGIGAARAK